MHETFAISYQAPLVSGSNDALFFFRNTSFVIVDADSK